MRGQERGDPAPVRVAFAGALGRLPAAEAGERHRSHARGADRLARIDELLAAHPFHGSRRLTPQRRAEGHAIGRKRGQRRMRSMGIEALGPKPNTAKPAPWRSSGHKIYPYPPRGPKIERPNCVGYAGI
ncbi:MAG: IS3 family transposase, partial [Methylocella sp.]